VVCPHLCNSASSPTMDIAMITLTREQIEVLSLHRGTTKANPRRNPMNGKYFREFRFPSHPSAMALFNRGLLEWRGHDGNSPGGWFITKAGKLALSSLPTPKEEP
jgi:hypothetical protein